MSTQVQFRRGTTTQNNAFTGANGEISVDTDVKTLRLHDGVTGGGAAIMLNTTTAQTALNKTFSTGSVWNGNAVGLAYGGTGSSLTGVAGAIAYSGASGLGLSAAGTSGQVLVSGGTSSPVWVNASSLTTGVATTAVTATNIAGGSAGQLIIQSDTGLSTFITAGAAGTFLKSAGAGYAPQWAAGQVTIGSTSIALGNTATDIAGLTSLSTAQWSQTTFTGTTSGTTPTQVYSFPYATYRSGEFTIQITNGTAYKIMKMMVIHDGTTASVSANYLTDSELQTATTNTTITATISGANVIINATASSGTSVIKGKAVLMAV